MRKLLIALALLFAGFTTVNAQNDDDVWYPKHLGVGIGVGTTGINIDLSTNINKWLGIRAGIDIMPRFKVNTDLGINIVDPTERAQWEQITGETIPDRVDVQGKPKLTTGHFLIDVYPFGAKNSFHVTIGAYFGASEIVSVYNKDFGALNAINRWNNDIMDPSSIFYGQDPIGLRLGEKMLYPDAYGNAEAVVKVKGFRPYIGLGYGRAVPRTKRFGCQVDLGVQFWGKPKVYAQDDPEPLPDTGIDGDGGAIKTISKIKVYPVLNFRLVGRIF